MEKSFWVKFGSRLVASAGLAACLAYGGSAHSTEIALFNNNTYVDYSGTGDTCGSEADNLIVSIDSFGGHNVTTFTGISAAEFSAALEGKQVLVIPELEEGDLAPDLSPEAISVIADFVNQGGRLLVFGSSNTEVQDLLNALFGYSLVVTGTPGESNKTAAAAGTIFADGPATLPYNDDTGHIPVDSLPEGAVNVYNYNDGSQDYSVLTILPFGAGQTFFFGWDWFGSTPGGDADGCIDGEDGGWQSMLAAALVDFSADLEIQKTSDVASVEEGEQITFTITVTNNGPATAEDVVVTDTLPVTASLASVSSSQGSCGGSGPVICELGSLENGASATITLVVTAEADGILSNLAEVSAANEDPVTDNNTATASVIVTALAPSLISGAGCSLASGAMSGSSLSGLWALALAGLAGLRLRKSQR